MTRNFLRLVGMGLGMGLGLGMALGAAPAAQALPVAAAAGTPAAAVPSASPAGTPLPAASNPKPVPTGNVRYRADIDGDGRADTVTFAKVNTRRGLDNFRLAVRTATGRSASTVLSTDAMGKPASDYWGGVTGIDGIRGNEVVLDLVGGVGDGTDIRSYAWRGGRIVLVPAPGRPARFPDWEVMWPGYGAARGWTFSQARSVRYVVRHDYTRSSSGRFFGTDTRYRWAAKGWQRVSTAKVSGLTFREADRRANLNGLTWR